MRSPLNFFFTGSQGKRSATSNSIGWPVDALPLGEHPRMTATRCVLSFQSGSEQYVITVPERARVLVVAIGDPLTARLATERALRLNPRLTVAARARGRREIDALRDLGAGRITDPEAEAAFELARHALHRMGISGPELTGIVSGLRRDVYGRDRD